MDHLPLPEWQASLDAMDAALSGTLASLEGYQSSWAEVLTDRESDHQPGDGSDALHGLEVRLSHWDARLVAAEELARSVEQLLDDGEAAVSRWRESFTGWGELIQQRGETRTTP